MLKLLKCLLIPTRFDAMCWAIATHWIVAVLSVTVLHIFARRWNFHEADAIVCVAAATWLAVAATMPWKANSGRRTTLLLFSSIASLAFVIAWYCFSTDFLRSQSENYSLRGASNEIFESEKFLHQTFESLRWGISIALFVGVVNWFALVMTSLSKNWFARRGQLFRVKRTHVLTFTAAVLFVIAVAGRIMTNVKFDGPESGGIEFVLASAVALLGIVLGWAVVLFWFPRSFASTGKLVQKVVSLLLAAIIFVPVAMETFGHVGEAFKVVVLVSGAVFFLSVPGVGGRKLVAANVPEQAEQQTAAAALPVAVSRPSVFSFISVSLAAVAIAMPWFFELTVLMSPRPGVTSIFEQFEIAHDLSKSKWNSDSRVEQYFDIDNQMMVWQIQFDESAPANLLDAVQGQGINLIELCDLKPGFDLSGIKGKANAVKLTNCEISFSQLNDILNLVSGIEIKGSLSIVDDGTVVNPGSLATIEFRDTSPLAVSTFFKAAKCEKKLTWLLVHGPVANEDWPFVEEVAQSGVVYLYGGWTDDFQLPKQTRSLKKVHVTTAVKDVTLFKNLILNTDIVFHFGGRLNESPEAAWNLLMLRGSSEFFNRRLMVASGGLFAEHAKEIGMAYQINDDQSIDSLYFPWGADEAIPALSNLKVLSYDPSWVGLEAMRLNNPIAVGHLKSQTRLEELYFDPMFVPLNLGFLENLPSLKHLQIPSVVRRVTGPVGFDACQSLESITFLGTPDNKSYREVAKLKNLKRLVIVNFDEDSMLSPRYRDKLAEKLPGVEVELREPTEMEALIPKPFREYRDQVRKELREDTSWLDEALR